MEKLATLAMLYPEVNGQRMYQAVVLEHTLTQPKRVYESVKCATRERAQTWAQKWAKKNGYTIAYSD